MMVLSTTCMHNANTVNQPVAALGTPVSSNVKISMVISLAAVVFVLRQTVTVPLSSFTTTSVELNSTSSTVCV